MIYGWIPVNVPGKWGGIWQIVVEMKERQKPAV